MFGNEASSKRLAIFIRLNRMLLSTTMARWECSLCAKKNDENETESCVCCKRPRDFAPKSYINATRAQPLALHGLASGKHPFRPEQIETLVRGGLDLGTQDTVSSHIQPVHLEN